MEQSQQPLASQDPVALTMRVPGVAHNAVASSCSSPPPNSPSLSADDLLDPNTADTVEEMGQFNNRSAHRAPLPPRPDWSEVVNIEQYKQFQKLVVTILDGMNKSIKELWDDMGVVDKTTEPRIIGPVPMQAMCVSVPNPYSPKYAHLYGNKPIYPDGEGLKDADDKTLAATGKSDKAPATIKPKSKWGKPPVPIMPPGINTDDVKSINAGNKSKFGPPPAPTLPPGVTSDMLPLKMPKSFQEAVEMFGVKTDDEIKRAQVTELKRDTLAHFGKFKANVAKRIDIIVIKKGGNEANVTEPVLPAEAHGRTGGGRRGNFQNSSVKGRQQQQSFQSPASRPEPLVQQPVGALGSGIPVTPTADFDAVGIRQYPPYPTPLSSLAKEKRACILHCATLLVLGLESYSSYARILLCYLTTSLNIPMHILSLDEVRIGKALAAIVNDITPEELQARRLEEGKNRFRGHKLFKQQQQQQSQESIPQPSMHLASSNRPASASVNESICGLAVPLVSARLSTVFSGLGVGPAAAGTMLQGMAESHVVVGTLFALYGSRATAKMTESYAKDIQDFGLYPVNGQQDRGPMYDPYDVPALDRRLRLTIGITGFFDSTVLGGDNCLNPWKCLGELTEVYALQWEKEVLFKTGAAFDKMLSAPGWTEAKQDKARSVAESLNDATWSSALIRCSKIIDNPWSVSLARAEKCGQVLADAILNKIGGDRPVTLLGFGAGARAVWVALMALSEKRAFGFVENAVLMGSPGPSNVQSWAAARAVVSGRLVNVFSQNDTMMGFAMRQCNFTEGIAGLEEIVGVPGVENYDVSNILTAHNRYRYLVGPILHRLGWEDVRTKERCEQGKELDHMITAEVERDSFRAQMMAKVAAARAEQEQKLQLTTAKEAIEKSAAAPNREGTKV